LAPKTFEGQKEPGIATTLRGTRENYSKAAPRIGSYGSFVN